VGSEADPEPHWNRFLEAGAVQPIATSGSSMSYREATPGDCDGLTVSQCHLPGQTPDAALARSATAASSDFFDPALPDAGIQALLQAIPNRLASGKRGAVLFDLMGGAISAVPADAAAFVHRNALFSAQYLASFPAGTSVYMASILTE
jgi:hypothetical protein